jgi:lysophospholipase L1-like esterase
MLLRPLTVVLAAFAALNGVVAFMAWRTGLGRQPIDVQTRGIYELRLAQLEQGQGAQAAVLGDSVVFGAHLEAAKGRDWPRHALPGRLEAALRAQRQPDMRVLNLGINGVLFRELNCVVRDVLARRPELLFVNLSPRPFATDFAQEDPSSARPFVCPEPGFAVVAASAARRYVPALRYRDAWQFGWLGTTPRARARDAISSLFSVPEPAAPVLPADADQDEEEGDDAFVAGMLWRFRAAQRLNAIQVSKSHPQARELDALLTALREAPETRSVVFYLHEDESALAGQLEGERFAKQSALFAAWVRRGLAGVRHAHFVEVPSRDLTGRYVDHVHLDAAGYAKLATLLVSAVPAREADSAATH